MTIDAPLTSSPSPEPIQIPGVIRDFMTRATIGIAGTRDTALRPRVLRVSGWRVEADSETISCMIPEVFTRGLLQSLEDNGQFTLTVEEIGPHETYQFKGTFLDAAPCTSADRQVSDRLRERFVRAVSPRFGWSEAACRAFVIEPSVTVRFRVREIYVQTPGPGAGRRLVPPAES